MKVLITGADGFIAKNLIFKLRELGIEVISHYRSSTMTSLLEGIPKADFIFHLAGVNRPLNNSDFSSGNYEFTKTLCEYILKTKSSAPIIFTSSIQAEQNNPYGLSKLKAENEFQKLGDILKSGIAIYRLPNIFGKWSKPNYNSVVATFCYNVINNIPLDIHNETSVINLIYIDDLIDEFLRKINFGVFGIERPSIQPEYSVTIGELASTIESFKVYKDNGFVGPVGTGLYRALYSTYLSFYKPVHFKYSLKMHSDKRGIFVEMLKTKDFGQFSFFTAHPGVTRGEHYHHTKNEKFLVVKGLARFKFRNIVTNEKSEIIVAASKSEIIETVPGWTHDITNIGQDEMVVIIWSNEIFDKTKPDTIFCKV